MSHTHTVSEVNRVIGAVATGDLSQRMALEIDGRPLKGEFLRSGKKAMSGDRGKCLEAGASDYISKLVDVGRLLSLLRAWLDRAGAQEGGGTDAQSRRQLRAGAGR
jgi:hypothetical protein